MPASSSAGYASTATLPELRQPGTRSVHPMRPLPQHPPQRRRGPRLREHRMPNRRRSWRGRTPLPRRRQRRHPLREQDPAPSRLRPALGVGSHHRARPHRERVHLLRHQLSPARLPRGGQRLVTSQVRFRDTDRRPSAQPGQPDPATVRCFTAVTHRSPHTRQRHPTRRSEPAATPSGPTSFTSSSHSATSSGCLSATVPPFKSSQMGQPDPRLRWFGVATHLCPSLHRHAICLVE